MVGKMVKCRCVYHIALGSMYKFRGAELEVMLRWNLWPSQLADFNMFIHLFQVPSLSALFDPQGRSSGLFATIFGDTMF